MSSADERIINRLQKIYDAQGAGGASFEELTGEPTDNAALGSALNGKVPTSRTVAGKALSSDVTLVKADVGLGNVDNTADAGKPVSTAQQTALDLKVPTSRTVNGQALSGNVVVTGLMLDTAGAPDNGVGANGDYAFDDATKTIYGPKAGGVWPAGVVLEGQSEAQVQALIAGEVGVTISRGGYATTLAEGDPIVLTVSSKRIQRFTGTDATDVTMPVTSTLYLGYDFLFINRSTQPITLKSSGGNTILVVPGGAMAQAVCVLITGTTAASWAAEQISDFAGLDSPAFINNPTAPTQSAGDNSTKLATTAYVATQLASEFTLAVQSGTYAPSVSAPVNLDSDPTPAIAQFLRVGTVVTVSGSVNVDITAAGTPTSFRLTLPIVSNFAGEIQAGGTAASESVAGQVAAIKARIGGDVILEWVSIGTASQDMFYNFTYQIVP